MKQVSHSKEEFMGLPDIIPQLLLKGKYSAVENHSANNSTCKSSSLNDISWHFLCVTTALTGE